MKSPFASIDTQGFKLNFLKLALFLAQMVSICLTHYKLNHNVSFVKGFCANCKQNNAELFDRVQLKPFFGFFGLHGILARSVRAAEATSGRPMCQDFLQDNISQKLGSAVVKTCKIYVFTGLDNQTCRDRFYSWFNKHREFIFNK